MDTEMFQKVFPFEVEVCCLECHYLAQPNPSEAIYVCLRSLEVVEHEIEEGIECCGFEEVHGLWVPTYVEALETYV